MVLTLLLVHFLSCFICYCWCCCCCCRWCCCCCCTCCGWYQSYITVASHFRAHRCLCVEVARRRSAVDEVDARQVRSDTGVVWFAVAVGGRLVDAATRVAADDDAIACRTGKGTRCSTYCGCVCVHERLQHARDGAQWRTLCVCICL